MNVFALLLRNWNYIFIVPVSIDFPSIALYISTLQYSGFGFVLVAPISRHAPLFGGCFLQLPYPHRNTNMKAWRSLSERDLILYRVYILVCPFLWFRRKHHPSMQPVLAMLMPLNSRPSFSANQTTKRKPILARKEKFSIAFSSYFLLTHIVKLNAYS